MTEGLPVVPKEVVQPRGFSVEVTRPDLLFSIVQNDREQIANGAIAHLGSSPQILRNISRDDFSDALFSRSGTQLFTAKESSRHGHYGQEREGIKLRTMLFLSDERRAQADYGHFSEHTAQKVRAELARTGYSARFRKENDVRSRKNTADNVIDVEKDGITVRVTLGASSIDDVKKDAFIFEDDSTPRQVLENNWVWIELLKPAGSKGQDVLLHEVESEDEFTKVLDTYAQVYEDALQAIYTVEGVPVPDKTITLPSSIPDVSYMDEDLADTLRSLGLHKDPEHRVVLEESDRTVTVQDSSRRSRRVFEDEISANLQQTDEERAEEHRKWKENLEKGQREREEKKQRRTEKAIAAQEGQEQVYAEYYEVVEADPYKPHNVLYKALEKAGYGIRVVPVDDEAFGGGDPLSVVMVDSAETKARIEHLLEFAHEHGEHDIYHQKRWEILDLLDHKNSRDLYKLVIGQSAQVYRRGQLGHEGIPIENKGLLERIFTRAEFARQQQETEWKQNDPSYQPASDFLPGFDVVRRAYRGLLKRGIKPITAEELPDILLPAIRQVQLHRGEHSL